MKKKVIQCYIYSFSSERQIKEFIKNNDKHKIFIFHFSVNDCIYLTHIKYIIENYKENVTQDKQFIFIIHLNRYFKNITYEEDEILNNQNLISHLSTYNQIFIDNLNGSTTLINEIINLSNEELFKKEDYFNYEKQLKVNLYSILMKIKYNISNNDFNEQKYHNILIEEILKNDYIKEKIFNIIIENIKSSKNIFEEIFQGNNFERNDSDLTSVIHRFMKYKLNEYVSKFIIKAERDEMFSIFLLNNSLKENKYFFKLIDNYYNNISIKNVIINNNPNSNPINLIIGLNIPGINKIFEPIKLCINNFKDEYLNLENEIRNSDKNKEEIIKDLIKLEKTQNSMEENIKNEFEKNLVLMDLINHNNIVLSDYLKIYISSKFKNNFDKIQKFLEYIIQLKFKDYSLGRGYSMIGRITLWLESYSNYIYELLNVYDNLSQYIPDLLKNIKLVVDSHLIKIKISDNNPEYKVNLNYPFIYAFESITISFFKNIELLSELNQDDFYNFIKKLKESSQNILKMQMNLRLYLTEIFDLISLTTVISGLIKSGLCNQNNLSIYLSYVQTESNLLNEKKEDEALITFVDIFNFLNNLLNQKEMFPNMIINIFANKFKKISYQNYRTKIFEIILNENKLIEKSKVLLNQFFDSLDMEIMEIDEDNTEENCINSFCSFTKEENNEILKLLNDKKNNPILNEIILYLFECKIIPYFYPEVNEDDNNNKKDYKILNLSFEYFKICVNFLDDYSKYINQKLNHLKMLYYIAYVKCYLYNFVEKNVKNFQEISDVSIVHDFLLSSKKRLRYVLKLFILKLFNISQFKGYHKFLEEIYNYNIKWIDEFSFKEKKNCFTLNYLFLNPMEMSLYSQEHNIINILSNLSNKAKEDFTQLLQKNKTKFDTFIDLTLNKIISNLIKKNYSFSKEYIEYSSFITYIFQHLDFTESSFPLMELIFNHEIYRQKLLNQILAFDIEKFEILLYSYKIVFQCSLLLNKNSFFKKISSSEIKNSLLNTYIPGGEPNDDNYIKSYHEIVELFQNSPNPDFGIYMCSCGVWYYVEPCGLPTSVLKCRNCGLDIGGTNHRLIPRDNHFRIFFNEKEKNEVEHRGYYQKMNNMLLSEFEKNYYDVHKKMEVKGFKKVDFGFFLNKKKEIRCLDVISYRLLSFILHSNIYFAFVLGYIDKNEIDNFTHDGLTTFNILEKNWNILKNELKKLDNKVIQVFFNQIFPHLNNLLNDYNNLSGEEERNQFEINFKNTINDIITNKYTNFSKIYIEKNSEILSLNSNPLKQLIQETINIQLENDQFPLYNYFTVPTYPNEKDLQNQLHNINDSLSKYPVLVNYFRCKELGEINLLNNILLMNPFEQYAINYYSYKITRDEAKNKKISDELKQIKNPIINKLYEDFEKGYNNMYDKATQYTCKHYEKKELRKISRNDSISYCLNDDGEKEFGMHIAAAYQELIRIQNEFLNPVLNNINQNGILYYFSNQISKEIPIQKASATEVVNFEIDSDSYSSLFEIISVFSYRNLIVDGYKIDYGNYRNIIYDFPSIEEELGKILLSGKKKFSDEQIFIVYGFEGYHGNKSNIIKEFYDKYTQKKLNNEQKQKLTYYKDSNCRNILFSLQLLIFYLQKENKNSFDLLSDVIDKLPDYISLCEDCKNLLETNNFMIENLIDIYEYIELISYDQIIDNVNEFYKKEISEDEKNKIKNYFEQIKTDDSKIIQIDVLSNAVRKFISRFLSGKREDTEYKEQEPLLQFIEYKEEIWDKEIFNDDKFNDEIEGIMKYFIVHTSQSVEFYAFLNKNNNSFIYNANLNEEINNDNNDSNNNDNNNNIEFSEIDTSPEKKKKMNKKLKYK